MNQNDTLQDTVGWFDVARPVATAQEFNVQLGCHLEEVVEMLEQLQPVSEANPCTVSNAMGFLKLLADSLKNGSTTVTVMDHLEFLDSLADQVVTVTGVAHTCGYDFVGAVKEVNRSNFSKFEKGIPLRNANNKIIKGDYYTPPNLVPYLRQE